MLLENLSIISLIITAIGYLTSLYDNILLTLPVFIGNLTALLLLWVLVCVICTRFIDMNKRYTKNSRLYRYFTNRIIGFLMQVIRVRLKVVGKEKIPSERFLFVSNHQSLMDPMAAMLVLSEVPVGFVAKKELFKIPVVGRLMYRCFCLSLDRNDIKESAKTITKASENIKYDICSMGIYPEGTRNKENELLPFMNGAFKIAKKAECPILVGVIKNAKNISKNYPFKKTEIEIEFIEVIDAETVKSNNTTELSNFARKLMGKCLKND